MAAPLPMPPQRVVYGKRSSRSVNGVPGVAWSLLTELHDGVCSASGSVFDTSLFGVEILSICDRFLSGDT